MANIAAARRYAQAVFEIASERGELDKWRQELAELARMLRDPAVHAALENPAVPFSSKQELLEKALAGLSPLALNLAYVLVKSGKVSIVDQLAMVYGALADDRLGILHATATSAVPMNDQERVVVAEWLGKHTGKKVVLELATDSQLLGGLVVRMGDTVIDASVRTRLERLKRNLLGAGSAAGE